MGYCSFGGCVGRDREAALKGEEGGEVDYCAGAGVGGGGRWGEEHVGADVTAEGEG